jgi:hypothetical protein
MINPPENLYIGTDIVNMDKTLNDNLMFDYQISELNLSDIIGNLRAVEINYTCKILIKYGVYHSTLIENKWLDELNHLPHLKAWQEYAIYKNRGTFIGYQLEHMKKFSKLEVLDD